MMLTFFGLKFWGYVKASLLNLCAALESDVWIFVLKDITFDTVTMKDPNGLAKCTAS